MKTPPNPKTTSARPAPETTGPAPETTGPAPETTGPAPETTGDPATMPEVLAGPVISPTPGRILWYYNYDHEGAQGAFVAAVHSDRLVNLSVCDASGHWKQKQFVTLVQPGETTPHREYCAWMPFQVGQAARYSDLGPRPDPQKDIFEWARWVERRMGV